MKPKYHGWIYLQQREGFNDAFYVSSDETGNLFMGYGVIGSEAAVRHFEETLGLGPIKLHDLGRLGLRVYTEEAAGLQDEVHVEVTPNHEDYQGMTLQAANDSFWAHIAQGHPERTTGDMPVDEAIAFDRACLRAYNVWLRSNKQEP
jgi:hypothetical protein